MVTFPINKTFFIFTKGTVVKLVEGQSIHWMTKLSNPSGCCFQSSAQTYFPLQGKDKFPLDEGDIFESKFPLVARIGLAARACGSGIGQSPSNSVGTSLFLINYFQLFLIYLFITLTAWKTDWKLKRGSSGMFFLLWKERIQFAMVAI